MISAHQPYAEDRVPVRHSFSSRTSRCRSCLKTSSRVVSGRYLSSVFRLSHASSVHRSSIRPCLGRVSLRYSGACSFIGERSASAWIRRPCASHSDPLEMVRGTPAGWDCCSVIGDASTDLIQCYQAPHIGVPKNRQWFTTQATAPADVEVDVDWRSVASFIPLWPLLLISRSSVPISDRTATRDQNRYFMVRYDSFHLG